MIATAIITFTFTGFLQRYDSGVMDSVLNNRQAIGQLSRVQATDCIAVPWPFMLGENVSLSWPNGNRTDHIVCDCSNRLDFDRHRAKGLIAELPYSVALDQSVKRGRYRLPMDGPLAGVRLIVSKRMRHQPI